MLHFSNFGKQVVEIILESFLLVARRGEGKMATKKAADHTLYHLSSRGFWKKFRALPRLQMEEFDVGNSNSGTGPRIQETSSL
jgi:hypothetical protein